jgi:hypothetical protein
MALLLIDNRIMGLPFLLRCLKSNVTPVLFDFEKDSFESITEKIPEQGYTHLGILPFPVQSDTYCLMSSFGESVLKEVEQLDPGLDTWTSFHLLVELCVSRLGVRVLDMLSYFPTQDLEYLSFQWNLPIRYSSRPLGKQAKGSHWSLNGDSLVGLYFTQSIESYPYTLGPSVEKLYENHYEKQIMGRILQGRV